MCSTCNHKTYTKVTEQKEWLEKGLGFGSLLIRCDPNGRNYRLAVKGEGNSEYKLYSCPSCGTRLKPY